MLLNHPLEIENDSIDPDCVVWRCTICQFSFANYHRQIFCKQNGHPAIWRDRYAINPLRHEKGAARYPARFPA